MSGGAVETAIMGLWLLATSQRLTLLGVSTQKTLCPLFPVGLQGDTEQGEKHCLGGELGVAQENGSVDFTCIVA